MNQLYFRKNKVAQNYHQLNKYYFDVKIGYMQYFNIQEWYLGHVIKNDLCFIIWGDSILYGMLFWHSSDFPLHHLALWKLLLQGVPTNCDALADPPMSSYYKLWPNISTCHTFNLRCHPPMQEILFLSKFWPDLNQSWNTNLVGLRSHLH